MRSIAPHPRQCLIHAALATNANGQAFLDANSQKTGVITRPSGLQYKVLQWGSGKEHPLSSTDTSCHYEGRTAQEYSKTPQGKVFDSSYQRGEPASFAPNQVIGGWYNYRLVEHDHCPPPTCAAHTDADG